MKQGFVRLAAAAPEMRLGDVEYNIASYVKEAEKYVGLGAKLIAFPELSVVGATSGDMFFNKIVTRASEDAVARFAAATKKHGAMFFLGVPVALGASLYNCAAVIFGGELIGLVPSSVSDRHFKSGPLGVRRVNFAGFSVPFGKEQLFSLEGTGVKAAVRVGKCDTGRHIGENVCVILAAEPEGVGISSRRVNAVMEEAERERLALVYSNAGEGESGAECVYSGHAVIADPLGNFARRLPFSETELMLDIDMAAIESLREKNLERACTEMCAPSDFDLNTEKDDGSALSKTPFVPEDRAERREATRLALEIQARGLAGRFERSHSKTMVIGISGGLDSTLALLAAARATDILKDKGVKRSAISAITMPCFGTTERTKGNAERLSELLGARLSCIDIKRAVSVHFEDIGHNAENLNVVYENAQARERTQVLMDIANAEGGLVVGTGDLSEAALGWATYNGDHMSMYGVNSSIPKTLVRAMVEDYADECENREIASVLYDILATPVSPELLPPKGGEIAQCTEGIVGPYELHDFFIYHFVREGTEPKRLAEMAKRAFAGVYDEKTVEGWCRVFLKRFVTQQFKRSCTPDGPSIGIVSLSPRGAWQMPSDFSPALMDF